MLTLLASTAMLAQSVTLGNIAWLGIVFFVLAIVAYLFGANGIAGMSAGIGRTLMFVFLVVALVMIVMNFIPRG